MIVFHNVSLVYPNGVHALSNVELSVTRGEFMFLVGSTGQGKSSLLRCIYKEVTPTSGDLTVDGRLLSELPRGQIPMLRRKLGVVFQDFKLLHQKTVWENVAYALSGGEQQRTAIARSLVNNPLILLCDEPTGNLDPETSGEIMALLARINAKGTTVVVATHNQAVVDRMRRRVVRMVNGRIAHDEEQGRYHVGLG